MSTLHYWIPERLISHLASRLAHAKTKWWKNWAIRHFIKRYQVDLSNALLETIEEYPDFNSFFTRQLKPNTRPIVKSTTEIASPVDGTVSQIGKIRHDLLIQAKNFHYTVNALLGGSEKYAHLFYDGSFATFYLSPKDYHRVHMPASGKLLETIYVPGSLFSVSPKNVHSIPQLFVQNERLICFFDTDFGPMAVILVGAIIVSGIQTVWPLTKHSKTITQQSYVTPIELSKGAELGHFTIGSTVILLLPNNTITWAGALKEGSAVKMGEGVGDILKIGAVS